MIQKCKNNEIYVTDYILFIKILKLLLTKNAFNIIIKQNGNLPKMVAYMKSNITILDLARVSGVSKSTISRYLRGESVSKTKAEIIEKAIIKTGYIRNNYAQLLRTSKSNFIGVLVPDIDNPFFTNIIKRLDELAFSDGKTLIIKTTMSQLDRELVVEDMNFTIPVISIDKSFRNLISITTNNYRNGYILTKHVFKHTKGEVMFFSREKESNSVKERIRGYFTYCKEFNHNIYSYKYNRGLGVDFNHLKNYVINHNIEAVIARNDNEAIKIQSFFNDLYYKNEFPRIRVAGFDNIRLSRNILPRLTTIDQKIEEMCDLAYDKYKNHKKDKIKTYVQNSELIIRESTL